MSSLSNYKFRHLLTPREIYGGHSHMLDFIAVFNRRLTKRMSSCQMQLLTCDDTEEDVLRGGVKINFKFLHPIRVYNELQIGDANDRFATDFKFSTKTVLVMSVTSRETVADLLDRICDKFNILESPKLFLYERELSVRQQDIFLRRLADDEIPLLLNFVWSLNQERKSIVLTDHDPNEMHYSKLEMGQLEKKIESLGHEEAEALKAVEERFQSMRKIMEKRLRELKKP